MYQEGKPRKFKKAMTMICGWKRLKPELKRSEEINVETNVTSLSAVF